jgi:Ca-activated chloride channel family protein
VAIITKKREVAYLEKTVEFKQIILVTDGESNVGENPVDVAKRAYDKGITVNTIGIIDSSKKEEPLVEIQKIATAGRGIWELTDINNLSQTMRMVTQKSVYKTIEEAVSKELKIVLGKGIEDIHPDSRKKIIDVIDKFGEEINIKCCIVLDLSGSMTDKIEIAKNSVKSLLRFLKERKGKTQIAVIGYPDENESLCNIISDFTEELDILEERIMNIRTGGTTPTGPALIKAITLFTGENEKESLIESYVV